MCKCFLVFCFHICREGSEHDFEAWSRNLAAASLGCHKCSNPLSVCLPQSHGLITESSAVGLDVVLNVEDILYDALRS